MVQVNSNTLAPNHEDVALSMGDRIRFYSVPGQELSIYVLSSSGIHSVANEQQKEPPPPPATPPPPQQLVKKRKTGTDMDTVDGGGTMVGVAESNNAANGTEDISIPMDVEEEDTTQETETDIEILGNDPSQSTLIEWVMTKTEGSCDTWLYANIRHEDGTVHFVIPDGDMALSGIKEGDQIVSINGEKRPSDESGLNLSAWIKKYGGEKKKIESFLPCTIQLRRPVVVVLPVAVQEQQQQRLGQLITVFSPFVEKVLKQIHPNLTMSEPSKTYVIGYLEHVVEMLFDRMLRTGSSSSLTITPIVLNEAAKSILPGELSKHAIQEMNKASGKFKNSVNSAGQVPPPVRAGLQFDFPLSAVSFSHKMT
jgi:hypothetical protein